MTTSSHPMRRACIAAVALFAAFSLLASPASAQTRVGEGATGLSGAGFGGTAAVGNGEVFVGSAPIGWQTGSEPAGSVFRYVRGEDGQWTESSRIAATDGELGDDFGRSLFLDAAAGNGGMLVVGAPGVGAAYVFEKANGAWTQTGKLSPSKVGEKAEFGGSYARAGMRTGNIAVAGGRIAVSAFGPDATQNAVHVFRKVNGMWKEESVLHQPAYAYDMGDPDAAKNTGFGYSIASAENTIFVAANGANARKGAIHVFSLTSDGWQPSGVLSSDSLSERASLGQAITFDASVGKLYAAAPMQQGGGAVYVFQSDGTLGWLEAGRIDPPKPDTADERQRPGFGSALAASNGSLLIGTGRSAHILRDGHLATLNPSEDRSKPGFGFGVAINGDVALVGSPSADYEEGVTTLFEYMAARGDSDSGWYPVSLLASELSFLKSISGDQVDCKDGAAEMFGCDNVDMLSFVSSAELTSHRGVKMTDIWGWEDPETGKEWVLLGRTDGTAFVDISDPNHPVYAGQLYRTEGSPGSAWRDIKVYKNHAYIVADGAEQHGVQIFDLTQLRSVDPAAMPVTFDETAHYDGTASTHNIVINEETGFAYAVGNRSGGKNMCGGQLHIFDIREPTNPKFAGCFSAGEGGTHDAQCVIYRGADTDYNGREICFASNGSSFVIGDVTDKDSTVTVANTSYPNQAYTHQGWLSEDHNHFYMNDELDEMNGSVDRTRTLIWDVSDLEDPQLVKEFFLDSGASDHNLYIRGNFMYQSNYQSGLRIMDVTDPVNPVEVGNFDTAPYAGDEPGFGGSWSNYPYFKSGVIAVSSRAEGLFILKKRKVDL